MRRFLLLLAGLALGLSLLTPVGAQLFTSITVGGGDASSPAISFHGDTDTGIFSPSANTLGFATGGSSRLTLTSTGLAMPGADFQILGNLRAQRPVTVSTSAGPITLATTDCNRVVVAARTSTTTEWVLPTAAAVPGCVFTFVTTSAASEVLLTPVTGDNFQIKATGDAGASVVTTASTGVKNTALTNVIGDTLTVVSDGLLTWIMIAQGGIWATR